MIQVVNKYKETKYYYIGRGSMLGNPFVMNNQSIEERNRVCDEYKKYIEKKVFIEKDKNFIDELNKLKELSKINNLNLGCFCAPKRCHGDAIKELLDGYENFSF